MCIRDRNKLATLPSGVLLSLSTIDPDIKTNYAMQTNLQIDHQITRRLSASVGYLRTRGIHIIMNRNLNVPTLTAGQDPVNLGRPNPNFANITQYSGQGDSYYNGLTAAVQHRSAAWATFRMSYAFSKAMDNTGNAFFSGPQNQFNIRDDRSLSDNNQTHRLTLSGQLIAPRRMTNGVLYKIVEGFQLSPIFTYGSPYPFNIVTGAQTIQTTGARLPGVGRNTGVGFNSETLDVRLSRQIRATERVNVEFLAESFNVLNHTNLQFPNNTWGTGATPLPTFGKATAASDPRQMQLGLKVSF